VSYYDGIYYDNEVTEVQKMLYELQRIQNDLGAFFQNETIKVIFQISGKSNFAGQCRFTKNTIVIDTVQAKRWANTWESTNTCQVGLSILLHEFGHYYDHLTKETEQLHKKYNLKYYDYKKSGWAIMEYYAWNFATLFQDENAFITDDYQRIKASSGHTSYKECYNSISKITH